LHQGMELGRRVVAVLGAAVQKAGHGQVLDTVENSAHLAAEQRGPAGQCELRFSAAVVVHMV
jgi:hypothetical protein